MAQIPSEANPQAPAPGGAPAPGPDQGGEGGGKVASLMSDTFKNLAMLSELIGASGDQAMAAKVQKLKADFEALLDGGGEDQGAPMAGGPVPMEAGGAKVRPAL